MRRKENQTKGMTGTMKKGMKKGEKGFKLMGIRNKITICFLVPLLFMIIVGTSAYQKAAEGMSDKFRDSTIQTIEMAKEYIDMSCTFIEAEAMKYAFDADVAKYLQGTLENDPAAKMEVVNSIQSDLMSSKTANPFISNIHIVTKENINILTTAEGNGANGILTEYKEAVAAGSRGVLKWIDSHDLLDATLEIKNRDYIMAYEILSKSSNGCIVVDIKESAIKEFIEKL